MNLGDDIQKNQRFLRELEQVIRLSNNEVIHKRVPPINTERMISFAVVVANLRAQYIEVAFNFVDMKQDNEDDNAFKIDELTLRRRRFEEARDAFLALQRAIELGYMSIE